MMDFNSYLTVLGPFLQGGGRLIRKCRHISSLEDLIFFLGLAQLHVHLHPPAAELLH